MAVVTPKDLDADDDGVLIGDTELTDEEIAEAAAPEPPLDPWTLSPPERAAVIVEMTPFVARLTVAYQLREDVVPACWYEHEHLVLELLAWKQYRQMMYAPTSSPTGPQDYHFMMQNFLMRMRAWVQQLGCANGHKPGRPQRWARQVDDAQSVFERPETAVGGPDVQESWTRDRDVWLARHAGFAASDLEERP